MPRPLVLLLLLAATAAAKGLDSSTLKKMEEFGAKWWKARPKTKFQDWDPTVRAALLEEARAFGPLPEDSLAEARDAFRKTLKKYGPKGKGKQKLYIEGHGYTSQYTNDEMWAFVKGGGRNKGLVVGLHGGGEGAGSADTSWTLKGCMGIYPQGLLIHGDNWNRVHGEKQILTLIEIAKAQYDIDPDRVFVMGFSMGGTGSWHMAGRFPDLFAGAAPCNGVLMANPKSQLPTKEEIYSIQYGLVPNVRNLPMYYFTGTADKNCMPGTYLYVWDRIQELRQSDPGGYQQIEFKCYEGLAHTFPPGEPANLFKWMQDKRRDSFPKKIVWEYAANPHPQPDAKDKTRRYQKHGFYWIRHENPADRMEIVAQRDGNTFDVSLAGAQADGLFVMLNPEMIDVTQDVVVRLDGTEVYRGKPVPDFETVVLSFDDKLDRRLTFDRRIPLGK